MKTPFIIAFVALVVIAYPAHSDFAVAIKVINDVSVIQSGGAKTPLVFGQKIFEGDTVETGLNSETLLRFSSGSTVLVHQSDRMVLLKAAATDKQIKTEWGKFEFDVKSRDAKSKFRVHTPVTSAGVEGTEFAVLVLKTTGETQIALFKGKVWVTPLINNTATIILLPSQYIAVSKEIVNPTAKPIPSSGWEDKQDRRKQGRTKPPGAEIDGEEALMPPEESIPDLVPGAAPSAEGTGDLNRLFESGQNASSGFLTQETQEKNNQVPTPTPAKTETTVRIKIK